MLFKKGSSRKTIPLRSLCKTYYIIAQKNSWSDHRYQLILSRKCLSPEQNSGKLFIPAKDMGDIKS